MKTTTALIFIIIATLYDSLRGFPLRSQVEIYSATGCESPPTTIIFQGATDCTNAEYYCMSINNHTKWSTNTCNVTFDDFHDTMTRYGGRNYSLYYYYESAACDPVWIAYVTAEVVPSCEGIEEISCGNARTRHCMYVPVQAPLPNIEAPQPTNSPLENSPTESRPQSSPVNVPQNTPKKEISDDGSTQLSAFEKAIIGALFGGWAIAMLFIVLFIQQRRDTQYNQYLQMHDEPEEQQAVSVEPNKEKNDDKLDAVKMMKIPTSEITIDKTKRLGNGQASEVFEGTWRQKPVAIKMPRDSEAVGKLMAELTVFRELDLHPNIVEIYGYFYFENKLCVVLERCDKQNLAEKLLQADLPLADKFSIAMGIAAGMAHLHNMPESVIHRDLKPSNILLTKPGLQMIAKIADFDYSRFLKNTKYGTTISTPATEYAAPEALLKKYTKKSDVWAYGATLFYLLTRQSPFGAKREGLKQARINNNAPVQLELLDALPSDPFTKLLTDLTNDCLKTEPSDRPSFNQICARFEDFFNNFLPWSTNNNRNNNNMLHAPL